jgi:hypothetical protein
LPCDVTDDGVQQLGHLQRRTGEMASSQRSMDAEVNESA